MGVIETYVCLKHILRNKNMIKYIGFALTSRIGFAAADSLTGLKMIEKGVPKENLALMAVPLTPISVMLPLIISKFTSGPRPLNVWKIAYLPRVFMGIILAWLIYITTVVGTKNP